MTLRLGVFASHNGSNLQSIIDSCQRGDIDADVKVVIGNNANAFAFERARRAHISTALLNGRTHPEFDQLDEAIAHTLQAANIDLVCLAGYNKMIGPNVLRAFRNRILNVHRAPLPRFGGPGMYGDAILRAVLESGVTEAGATVHIVDEHYDHGRIIAFEPMPVFPNDTVETLAERVLAIEHRIYPATIGKVASGEINLDEDWP